MFISRGSKSTPFDIPKNQTQVVVTTVSYFSIMILLRVTFNRKWFVVAKDPSGEYKTFVTQKQLSESEVVDLLNGNPVNPLWWLFNQSLVWLIIYLLFAGYLNPKPNLQSATNLPNRPLNEILAAPTWTESEQIKAIKESTDKEFETFISKVRNVDLLRKIVKERGKIKKNNIITSSISSITK